jgi:hypothetical protein
VCVPGARAADGSPMRLSRLGGSTPFCSATGRCGLRRPIRFGVGIRCVRPCTRVSRRGVQTQPDERWAQCPAPLPPDQLLPHLQQVTAHVIYPQGDMYEGGGYQGRPCLVRIYVSCARCVLLRCSWLLAGGTVLQNCRALPRHGQLPPAGPGRDLRQRLTMPAG